MDDMCIYEVYVSAYVNIGNPKQCIQYTWELAMRTMLSADLMTRKLFKPVIESRMENMRTKRTYWYDSINAITKKFPQWSETRIFEFHDLFQMFEMTDTNQVEISQLYEPNPMKLTIIVGCW